MSTDDDDDKTPVDGPVWNMHPNAVKVKPGLTGNEQRTLDDILIQVHQVLVESRTIQEHGQRCAETALKAVEQIPRLQARMNRVELIAIGATIINIVMLFIASCVR